MGSFGNIKAVSAFRTLPTPSSGGASPGRTAPPDGRFIHRGPRQAALPTEFDVGVDARCYLLASSSVLFFDDALQFSLSGFLGKLFLDERL